ncbi:hypothetical protein [Peribacillus tepidiphilus]|jgi:hypothetical protein|uniref:hypothetical protein n=1 Tax=Peribacillus tepidiphilus TaxID=2652445 RepID=UPI0035B5170A
MQLAYHLNINNKKDVYFFPKKDVFFQPIFQCCSKDEFIQMFDTSPATLLPHMGIYLPDIDIQALYEDGQYTGFSDYVRDLFNEHSDEEFNEIIYASFCLFHEEGHYHDFMTSGLSVKEFIERDSQEKFSLEMQKEHIYTLPIEQRELMNQLWYINYFRMTAEKIANEYATKKIVENIDTILQFQSNE